MRYGYKKKPAAPLDINELFVPFATMPQSGISCDQDWINQDTTLDVNETIAEVFFYFPISCILINQFLDLGHHI